MMDKQYYIKNKIGNYTIEINKSILAKRNRLVEFGLLLY